ncbi:nuclear transport factor 2 family protein [Sphingobium sp. HWE2-09]|uniref:nuclear transport factor 2 family protein n=1 Tax=Sphingobium sp. HWE2-09 TaxID=3108390 RepID=UPI002DD173A9|nr:nuclear transport factor 2 family protein [Sphingobium sp. HWE2-09]
MSPTLEELAQRLQLLEDKEAIRLLKSRYLRACDLKQPDAVRDCFLPNAVRIAYQGFPIFTDRDAFVATYESMACQGGVYDIHHAANWDISVTGPDEARGIWSLNFRTILTGPRQVTRLAVEYDDLYRRQDGRWWIAETTSRVTSVLTEQIGEDGSLTVLASGEIPAN